MEKWIWSKVVYYVVLRRYFSLNNKKGQFSIRHKTGSPVVKGWKRKLYGTQKELVVYANRHPKEIIKLVDMKMLSNALHIPAKKTIKKEVSCLQQSNKGNISHIQILNQTNKHLQVDHRWNYCLQTLLIPQ